MSILLVIPASWLAVLALGLALCRAAASGDGILPRLRDEQPVATVDTLEGLQGLQ